MARKMQIPTAVREEKNKSEQVAISDEELRVKVLKAYDETKNMVSAKSFEKLSDGSDPSRIHFDYLRRSFQNYGEFLLLCDRMLESNNLSDDDAEMLQKSAVEVETKYNYCIDWFVKLSVEDKVKLLGDQNDIIETDTDTVKINDLQEVINQINNMKYFPQKEKDFIIEQMKELLDTVNTKYDNVIHGNVLTILFSAILFAGICYGIYLLIDGFLWHWMRWFAVAMYIYGICSNFGQLNSVREQRGDGMSIKFIIGCLGFN